MKCQEYDYVEIACMYHYLILLVLKDGSNVKGIAVDIQWSECHEECIKLDIENHIKLIPLSSISKMSAEVDNPHFQEIVFS